MTRTLRAFAATAGLALFAAAASAQPWPSKNVTLIAPFGAGSGVDILARHIAGELQEKLGKPFVVDNRVGANGNVGAGVAAKAPADGSTLLIVTPGIAVQNKYAYKTMPFDFDKDFSPIMLVAKAPMLVLVNPKLPMQTLAEMLAYAKANPGKINVSSTGVGSQPHVTLEMLKLRAGVDMTHVPYNSSNQQNMDVVSGVVESTINYVTTTLGLVSSGAMRALAITSTTRMAELPDVPTLDEAGFPGFEAVGWYGIFVPRGAPAEVSEKVRAIVNAWLPTEKARAALRDLGMQSAGGGAAELERWIRQEEGRWGPILKSVVTPQ